MLTIKKDITTIETGVIIHQTNCQNVMGSGIARAIYEKWPGVKEKYHRFCELQYKMHPSLGPLSLLGEFQEITVQANPEIIVINIFGQLNYGNGAKTGVRYTDYGALKNAFSNINKRLVFGNYDHNGITLPFYIPKFLGAGLGGGDYKIIHELIHYYCPDAILVEPPDSN